MHKKYKGLKIGHVGRKLSVKRSGINELIIRKTKTVERCSLDAFHPIASLNALNAQLGDY